MTKGLKHIQLVFALFLGAFLAQNAQSQFSGVKINVPNTPGPSLKEAEEGRVGWMTGVMPLGDSMRQNDFPSSAVASNGDVWAVWSSYSGLKEEIHARRFSKGTWYAAFPIPGVSGDVWMPQVAIDADGKPWFVWSQQVNYGNTHTDESNWDIFAARLEGDRWEGPIRLSDHPLPDIHHRLVADARGRIWLVWQGFRNGQSDVFLRTYDGSGWSETHTVTSDPGNDWTPDIAIDSAGNATVVWDTYRAGNYDVYMRSFRNGSWEKEKAVSDTASGEARASAAYDRQDRLWVAYEDIGVNWGKDWGSQSLGVKSIGTRLGEARDIRIKILDNERWMEPAAPPSTSLRPQERSLESPRLYADADGRMWLSFRHKVFQAKSFTHAWPVDRNQMLAVRNNKVFWESSVSYYHGSYWTPATTMPNSRARASSTMSAAAAPDGQFWIFWNTDNREDSQLWLPREHQVWSCVLTPATPVVTPDLVPASEREIDVLSGHPNEAADVQRLRERVVQIDSQAHRIYRGDLHRHTEISTDSGRGTDGSLHDFFRYMIDAAAMDFGAITDHSAGGDMEYPWWLIQKITEMHQVPGRYLALFGNERTAAFPDGHRNVIHPYRNVPIVKFHFKANIPEVWNSFEAASRDLVENDTKLLYKELHKNGGIAISHTSATQMGTDWRDNDPEVEPVVEIFQGNRHSYEHEGAPATDKPELADEQYRANGLLGFEGSYQPDGFVWKAWEKGHRLGVIASSDHSSTHLSYALVYSAEPTRAGIIEAIRKRHTYAASDNILLEFWMGDHFMGDEFTADSVPELRVNVRGTSTVAKVSVIRNNSYIFEQSPNTQEISLSFRDNSALTGSSYYYVRIEQDDGHIGWSSPIWVTVN